MTTQIAQMTHDVLTQRRSVRRFRQHDPLPEDAIRRIVSAAANAPSACNLQAIDFLLVRSDAAKEAVFRYLKWATNMANGAPSYGEKPVLYIVPLVDREMIEAFNREKNLPRNLLEQSHIISVGTALGNLVTQTHAEGIASCIIGAIDANAIRAALDIEQKYDIPVVVALGYPNEVATVELLASGSKSMRPKYYRDANGNFIVQKREPVIIEA